MRAEHNLSFTYSILTDRYSLTVLVLRLRERDCRQRNFSLVKLILSHFCQKILYTTNIYSEITKQTFKVIQ